MKNTRISTIVVPVTLLFAASCALRVGSNSRQEGSANGPTASDITKPPPPSSGVGGDASGEVASSVSTSGVGGDPSMASSDLSSSAVASSSASSATGGNGCYSEPFDANVSLASVEATFKGSQWIAAMLSTLKLRYPNGWFVVDQMKTDSFLVNDLPSYYQTSTWSGMIDAIDTACHEETHGYDFDKSLNLPGKHLYYLGKDLSIAASQLDFFPRNEILSEVQKGGSVTTSYDNTYLKGTQGSYSLIFLADELTAYTNGLACVTTVVDQLNSGSSFRDGLAAHLYYLELYLRIARTKHPTLYTSMKADASWQKFVRFSWARGHFWYQAAAAYPLLGSNDGVIWARVEDTANSDEIAQFTSDNVGDVACSP